MNETLWTLVFCALLFEAMTEACDPCTCRSTLDCTGRSADCEAKALTQVPTLPSDVCQLYLSRNKITTIKESDFNSLTNLKKLDLNHNSITSIDDNAFSNLTKLEKLFLDGNSINTIKNTAFIGLSNLKELLKEKLV
ncbi:opticin-like [Saccostrea cucullata]|uniref:opticin-like n=1 Tax=Saccostrea cuccullata TaxID=36930 RepID=UPI002ED5AAC9